MTFLQMFLTLLGGFTLPFFIILIWGRLVLKWKVVGGFIAAFILIGLIWPLNHGSDFALITQSGTTFIDMGISTGVGVFVHGICNGGKIKPSMVNVFAAFLGGGLAGLTLSLIF